MHVLHILEAFAGGTRRHVLDLLPAMQRQGVSCTLVASAVRNTTYEQDVALLQSQGVAVIRLEMSRGFDPQGDIGALLRLTAILRRTRPDIIHCHSSKAGFLGRLARSSTLCTPLVYTPHCLAYDTGLPRLQRRAARWVEQSLTPLTTRYVAVSQHEERVIRNTLARGKRVTTIPNGVNLEEFDALPTASRSDFDLGEDDFVIGCFGRLTAQKNQAALICILPDLVAHIPRATLFFVGEGEDRAQLGGLLNEVLQGRQKEQVKVVWAGEQSEARPLYELCDVVAQPSRWEGCPYSILEAMAASRSVVAATVGGVAEILSDDYGFSYLTSQRHSLATLLWRVARDSELREQTGYRARQRVEACFSLEQMVQRTLKVYESVLNSR
jgi:glycosyltransferase involved in cell wall biosynthesis